MAPISIVFAKSTLSEINFEVEKMKKEVAAKEKTNEQIPSIGVISTNFFFISKTPPL